jgi:hypothetical protein
MVVEKKETKAAKKDKSWPVRSFQKHASGRSFSQPAVATLLGQV